MTLDPRIVLSTPAPCSLEAAVKGSEPVYSRRVDVSLTLKDLPSSLAEEIEEVQRSDPDLMQRIVMYGMTRTAIFETLLDELSPAPR
jgi:hypothetical protein